MTDHHNQYKIRCPRGHLYSPSNTRVTRDGKRVYRRCDAARGSGQMRSGR